jgi:hypothetical protein
VRERTIEENILRVHRLANCKKNERVRMEERKMEKECFKAHAIFNHCIGNSPVKPNTHRKASRPYKLF